MAAQATDAGHMARAIELARRGLFTTDPNPRVGCVIADGERVIAEGWHEKAGLPHAEVVALAAAGAAASGATAYVTLEPCSHFGRTPPCADALVEAGIGRLVYAMKDPNPRVNGAGIARLTAAGIAVTGGVLEQESQDMNPGFISRMTRGQPWVTVKLAASLDGGTALPGGESHWITGEAAREDVQRLRARSSAVMTGSGTRARRRPAPRRAPARRHAQPLRVVLDSKLRTPRPRASWRRLARRWFCARMRTQGANAMRSAGAEVVRMPSSGGSVDLAAALASCRPASE
jgi:diaminohydroxyphosphoribosylaminopyrimidine deaminase/5-amino-6-(5-phosphoribosylamino)uracil reductase